MPANPIAEYPQSGGATLPSAGASGQTLVSSGAGTTYTAQYPAVTLIQEQTLASSVTTVTFSGIPQTFKHLRLIGSVNSAEAAGAALNLEFNGDTTVGDYTYHQTGSATSSGNFPFVGLASAGVNVNEILVPGYTSTTLAKRCVGTATDGTVGVLVTGMVWSGTAAITSLTISTQNTANMLAGSVFSLYGLS